MKALNLPSMTSPGALAQIPLPGPKGPDPHSEGKFIPERERSISVEGVKTPLPRQTNQESQFRANQSASSVVRLLKKEREKKEGLEREGEEGN